MIHNRAGSIGIHGGGEIHLVSHSAMDERYADDGRQSNFSLLLGRDDAFRDPDRIRLCLEVEFPLQCNDWLILGFAG